MVETTKTDELIISTNQLTKQFDGYAAVNQIDLQVRSGEVYGLIGPNGAGKTTLIRLLAAADEPTTGEVYICGHRFIRSRPNPEIKRQIGFLPDDFPLYDDLKVWEYLDYFGRLYYLTEPGLGQRINEVVELVSLEGKRDSLINTLSRGMKQRLSLARSIVQRPKLLLLDEPVSGLDPIARVQYRETIKLLQQQGITIFISSHILSDLEDFCTSIGIMEAGRLVESSQLTELYRRGNQQQILITALDRLPELQTYLQNFPQVEACQLLEAEKKIAITFLGEEADIFQLLRSLIEQEFPITGFWRNQESLESIFLKLGYQKTA
jgi:ABC-2 type transport system ATP-binding protein